MRKLLLDRHTGLARKYESVANVDSQVTYDYRSASTNVSNMIRSEIHRNITANASTFMITFVSIA